MRVFVAVEIGDEARRELGRLMKGLKWNLAFLRTVPLQNLHITLRFLGELERETVELIKGRLRNARLGERFRIRIKGVGGFPSKYAARVVWVGVEDGGHLKRLSERVDRALEGLPVPPRDKPFVSHITVGRSRRRVNVGDWNVKPVEFWVDRVVLYESILKRPNAEYRVLEYYELDGY